MVSPGARSSRLSSWAVRPESSWGLFGLPPTGRQAILTRLAVVLIAIFALTASLTLLGPPMPYRVGEILSRDLRVRVSFEVVNVPQTELLREQLAIRGMANPNASHDELFRSPPQVVERYPAGTPITRRGYPITERQFVILLEEHRAYVRSLTLSNRLCHAVGHFLIFTLLASVVTLYSVRFQPAICSSLPKIASVCGLVTLTVILTLTMSRAPWYAALIPLTVAAMTLTIVSNPPFALLMSVCLALTASLGLGGGLSTLLVMLAGMSPAVLLLTHVRSRVRCVQVAAYAGIGYFAMTYAVGILHGQTGKFMFNDALRNFTWSLLAGFILGGCLGLVERFFGIVTDIRLLELADGSHPLMQELIRRAPGTYTHSMTVATLAEAAAESIGANPLLTRVGATFHDIGKMLKPHYFIENQSGENRHDMLEPAMSALIIHGHVKDGVALGEQYQLPQPIIDFIQQHHGTTLVEYFYREAKRLQAANGHGSGELEHTFRYPGPKPQTREIGIVMLADAVESASRALNLPNPQNLRKLVHDILMKRLMDGQFDDSGLTLTELRRVEEALCKSLVSLYHARIKYPAQRAS